jgi:predicted KAP-like P-loop ATPase
MRADLDHAFRDRIQVLARLALHEKYFAMIKLDMLYHTVQRARFFSGREKTIVVPNRLEWAIAVAAWHRSSNPQETI